jgi:phage baseplate assembly protein W
MPLPQIVRVNPLDLQKNKAIGISIPFNGGGVFNSTLSTQAQIKSNLINLLLTSRGERIMNPQFGSDFKRLLFEPLTDTLNDIIRENILISINTFIPEITIINIDITPNTEENSITAMISYRLNISGTKDQIYVDFSTT